MATGRKSFPLFPTLRYKCFRQKTVRKRNGRPQCLFVRGPTFWGAGTTQLYSPVSTASHYSNDPWTRRSTDGLRVKHLTRTATGWTIPYSACQITAIGPRLLSARIAPLQPDSIGWWIYSHWPSDVHNILFQCIVQWWLDYILSPATINKALPSAIRIMCRAYSATLNYPMMGRPRPVRCGCQ